MDSNKSSVRAAVEPQRRHGKERVARLLEVGAVVIAEKGYDGATMAEIAERSGSPIGSLYRFFPNKEILANALIQRYGSKVEEAFAKIDRAAEFSPLEKTADSLLHLLVDLHPETKAMKALLEGTAEWSEKRMKFRNLALRQIAESLTKLAPALPQETTRNMAVVLLHNMKTMSALQASADAGAMEELRHMNRLYLGSKLGAWETPARA